MNVFTITIKYVKIVFRGEILKKAFTLVEVLITLGIIGVVAAMTLPAVINNSRNKQLEAGLKRSYSLISQALDMYQAETGERICAGDIGGQQLRQILIKYFKAEHDCGSGMPNVRKCINDYERMWYKTYNGKNNLSTGYVDDGAFVLNDGTFILLENSNLTNRGGIIIISADVNGFNKRPNRLGHDLFMFQVDSKGKLLPMGLENTQFYDKNDTFCSISSGNPNNGAGCTYKALTDKDFFKNLPK